MTLNQLIKEATAISHKYTSGDIPLTVHGTEVDIVLTEQGDNEHYHIEVRSLPTAPTGNGEGTVCGRMIDEDTYKTLMRLGILDTSVRSYNRGASDYSRHIIQPWTIWQDYNLNPWDADIVKRVLRHKATDTRKMDYEKIIHICEERIRQIEAEEL